MIKEFRMKMRKKWRLSTHMRLVS